MDYFRLLDFQQEPFSNSPDPDLFFQSEQHVGCLQKLELSIRMQRGLNVVIGEVGTGKTTLCRQLIRAFDHDPKVKAHLILDPDFDSGREFLATVASMLTGEKPGTDTGEWQLKELIKEFLFQQGVHNNRITLLIVDEGQKIPGPCLEILREFLNYETNDSKLLQTVIFAQPEFEEQLAERKNFTDRVNYYQVLGPLSFRETREMIRFRLDRASQTGKGPACFSRTALGVIFLATRGYPRKIVNLCHAIILSLIIQHRRRADWFLAYTCARQVFPEQARQWRRLQVGALSGVILVLLITGIGAELLGPKGQDRSRPEPGPMVAASRPPTQPPPATVAPRPPAALPAESAPAGEPAVEPVSKPAIATVNDRPAAPAPGISSTPVAPEPPPTAEPQIEPATDRWQDLETLGEIVVRNNDTLGEIIRRVYGPYSFTPRNTRKVLALNPGIKDRNRIEVGEVIRLPAIPVQLTPLAGRVLWVRAGMTSDLEAAYRFLQTHAGTGPPMLIIPMQGRAGKMRFAILLQNYFLNREAAAAAVAALPPSLAAKAEIIPGLNKKLAYFR